MRHPPLAGLGQHPMMVLGDRNRERRAPLFPVGNELVERFAGR